MGLKELKRILYFSFKDQVKNITYCVCFLHNERNSSAFVKCQIVMGSKVDDCCEFCFGFPNTALEHILEFRREVPLKQRSTTPNKKFKLESVLNRVFAPLSSIFENIPSITIALSEKF